MASWIWPEVWRSRSTCRSARSARVLIATKQHCVPLSRIARSIILPQRNWKSAFGRPCVMRQSLNSAAARLAGAGSPIGVAATLVLLMALVIWRTLPGLRPPADELLAQEIVSNHVRSLQLESHRTDVISSDQ